MAVNILYAALYEPGIDGLMLSVPKSHRAGPDYLNVLRVLDVPQAAAMAAERSEVKIVTENAIDWDFPSGVANVLGGNKDRFSVQPPLAAKP